MAKRILLVGLVLLCGCAGQRARVVLTKVNGEPSVSLEFEPITGDDDNAKRIFGSRDDE